MPKYNYLCSACSREWTQWSSIDGPLVECPHCFSTSVNKLPPSFVVLKDKESKKEKTAKQNVVEHIEENRKVLKQLKKDTRGKEYVKDV
tara:strand:+ start:1947 stop:2213 length:267 start_codon:yes stop_codon:yes gene_type:complete